jgi:uncharacterized protein (TIGR03435 family)
MTVVRSQFFKSLNAIILTVSACFALGRLALTQDLPAPPAAASTSSASSAAPSYEVVSIKPHKQGDGSSSWRSTEDGFSAQGASLMGLIFSAYNLTMPDQIVGLPSWGDSNDFDIDAKMDERTTAALQKLPRDERWKVECSMMRDVLADRFQLKIHKETRDLPIYNLVIAKTGSKLKETPKDKNTGYSVRSGKISGDGIPFDSLIMNLSGQVGRIVVNKTGLTGDYAIELNWQPDPMQAGAGPANADALPDLFTALQEQAGLKLEPAKGQVDVYVIDHIEKPSEN